MNPTLCSHCGSYQWKWTCSLELKFESTWFTLFATTKFELPLHISILKKTSQSWLQLTAEMHKSTKPNRCKKNAICFKDKMTDEI